MPSTFTWLDYSEKERRRALDVISLFKQRETRDELGLASIRDAFAEQFFPGTSTIQTRAKYFLLLPWMYLHLEDRKIGSDRIEDRGRRFEVSLIETLARSEDPAGVIGIEAGKALQRLPSNVYWAGMRRWGILLFEGSQAQYHRSLDRHYERVRRMGELVRDANDPEFGGDGRLNWHPHLPEPPEDFPNEASLALTRKEGEYLRERIRSRCQGSLLAELVELPEPWAEVRFAWQHPSMSTFPPRLASQLEHGRRFCEVMHGAALLYNLMLAEAFGKAEWIDTFEQQFEEWALRTDERAREWTSWDQSEFWSVVYASNPGVPLPTRRFVERWIELVVTAGARPLRHDREARRLVSHREAQLKRGRARLHNRRHLELWRGSSGSHQLDLRWPISQAIALDILRALG